MKKRLYYAEYAKVIEDFGGTAYGDPNWPPEVEVPDELWERWERVRAEFVAVQDELERYVLAEGSKEGGGR